MNTNEVRIIVGIAGPDESAAAVRFAVDEARRRRLPVHLVHALHPFLVTEDNLTAASHQPVVGEAQQMLDTVAEQVRADLGTGLAVTTELVLGHAATSLSDLSDGAALVALQPDRMGVRRHIPTYSVTSAVAARSRPAVVAVPAGWTEPGPGPVTVGVGSVDSSAFLLQAAFEEAQERGVALRIVHAWFYSSAFDDLVFEGERESNHSSKLADAMRDDLAALQRKFSDVPVDLVVRHGRAADVLVSQSQDSSLVVVGRHWTGHRVGHHLGSVVRAVLHESRSPVMVVDPVDPIWTAEDAHS